jgi:hypothetical protein
MRYPHICPHCDHRSTRWWNLKIHIKRKHGGYLPDRSSGRLMTNKSPSYSNSVQIRHATVADSVVDTFQPRFAPQQTALATSQYSPGPIYPPWQVMDDQINQSRLSQEKILKIEELKRLMYKYPQYHINPDDMIRMAVFNSINYDDRLLDGKLQQLRIMDRRLNGRASAFRVF